jgi:predicted metalloendopeptidase
MINRRLVFTALFAALALNACSPRQGTSAGVDPAAMDTSVRPGDDFYGYSNGAWQRATEIPGDRSSVSASYQAFLETERRNRELVDAIVASHPAAGTDAARIANFYNAYTNTAAIDAAGMSHIQPDLDRIAAISDNGRCRRRWVRKCAPTSIP